MLPFYGRRLSRNTNSYELENLSNNKFFFDEGDFKLLKKIPKSKSISINLEIGFGTGENLIFQSKKFKKEIFLACDPFLSGCLKLKRNIERFELNNILFTNLDYLRLYELAKEFTFRKIYVLFPDPWPKKRQKKRRLINLEFVKSLRKITTKNSEIFIATDDEDYSRQIRDCFLKDNYFRQEFYSLKQRDFCDYNLCPTKYFLKAMKLKNKVNFFIFKQ